MKFEIINNKEGHLSHKGYHFIENSERFFDENLLKELTADRGFNFVDTKFDIFYDGFEPICKGEDGKTYSVLFVYNNDEWVPFIWQEVEAEELTECA